MFKQISYALWHHVCIRQVPIAANQVVSVASFFPAINIIVHCVGWDILVQLWSAIMLVLETVFSSGILLSLIGLNFSFNTTELHVGYKRTEI